MNYPISRKTNVVVQETDGETLIYDLLNNQAFCLNQSAGAVFQLADGTLTASEIGSQMSLQFKAPVNEDIVLFALNELEKYGLLENPKSLSNKFAGISRRAAAKKIGLTSAVAIPLISAVVAPNVFAAASNNCPASGTCFPAGTPICGGAACAGDYPVTVYPAGSGCTGAASPQTLMCTPISGTFVVDVFIN